jgi:membrane protein YqaA with SNARE-associated domain
MFEWFKSVVLWIQEFVVGVPMYVAAPAMVIVGALDSSLLSIPEINDYLVVMRCFNQPSAVFYFPLFAALGSVIGCNILYSITRKGGEKLLLKRFRKEHIEKVKSAYERFGFLTIAVPSMLPPPTPFKIFVATAGALGYPRWKFMTTVMIARSVRYYIEGTLAIFFGALVLEFLKQNGPIILGIVATIVLIGLISYFIFKRYYNARNVTRIEEEIAGD